MWAASLCDLQSLGNGFLYFFHCMIILSACHLFILSGLMLVRSGQVLVHAFRLSHSFLRPLNSAKQVINFSFNAMVGTEIGDDLLKSCAELFSTNYGIWGEKASTVSWFTKPGQYQLSLDRSSSLIHLPRATGQDVWQKTTSPMCIHPTENCPCNLLLAGHTHWPCICEHLVF